MWDSEEKRYIGNSEPFEQWRAWRYLNDDLRPCVKRPASSTLATHVEAERHWRGVLALEKYLSKARSARRLGKLLRIWRRGTTRRLRSHWASPAKVEDKDRVEAQALNRATATFSASGTSAMNSPAVPRRPRRSRSSETARVGT